MVKKGKERKSGSEKSFQSADSSVRIREPCYCEASKHGLINNCLGCGRIVCEAEGSGRCFTCGDLVCSNKERDLINSDTAAGDALRKKLVGDDFSLKSVGKMVFGQEYQKATKAIEHKNKLLEYDRISKQQTKIIDDQCDYHQIESNIWISQKQKERLLKKKEDAYEKLHNRSKSSHLSIDFAGRKLIEESPECEIDVEELLNEDESIYEHINIPRTDILSQYRPIYCETRDRRYNRLKEISKTDMVRIQDSELQYMSDEGMCLSVHQPYASLIIAGIKKSLHEGRHWYTSFRGRLWIHSAALKPQADVIASVEAMYREKDASVTFPQSYPTGCIIGCVEITDCLSQDEYVIKHPDGECGSPYILICENPQELKVKIPMRGKRRIYKMDSKMHKAAKNTLRMLS